MFSGEPKIRILIVGDDSMVAEAVCANLKNSGYAVGRVKNGARTAAAVQAQGYDLLLLNLELPGLDGLQVLTRLRSSGCQVPVLVVIARDGSRSRLHGLDGGADDCIVKPFNIAELQARMYAILRRNSDQDQPLLSNGVLTLNPATYQVQIAGQTEPVALSNKEFAVLQALMMWPGTILSHSDLENKIYGWGEEMESNAVDFLIHSLRKKLGKEHIRNIRDVGWLVEKGDAWNTRAAENFKQPRLPRRQP